MMKNSSFYTYDAAQTVDKPVGGVGGSQPSDCQSDLSDMCGEVGSLAQQGFLAGFHGRTKGAVKTCFVGKDRQRRAFSTR